MAEEASEFTRAIATHIEDGEAGATGFVTHLASGDLFETINDMEKAAILTPF